MNKIDFRSPGLKPSGFKAFCKGRFLTHDIELCRKEFSENLGTDPFLSCVSYAKARTCH